MKYLRTPNERFSGLKNFNFPPNYVEVDDTQGGVAKGRRAPDEREAARQLHAGPVRGERDGGLVEGAHEDGDEEGPEGEAQHEGGPATGRAAACSRV